MTMAVPVPISASASGENPPNPASQLTGAERRTAPRLALDEDVQVHPIAGATSLRGRIRDLSLGGCRLEIDTRFLTGAMLRVELQFQVRGTGFRLAGVTAGRRTKTSLGIRFVDMNERRRADLAELLDDLAAAAKSAESSSGAGVATSENRAEPTPFHAPVTVKVSPDSALRAIAAKPAAATSAATPAKPSVRGNENHSVHIELPEAAQAPASSANGSRDRRAYRRLKVDTRARLHLVKTGILMNGAIQDLSMAGCRIVTEEDFTVGIYVRVETEFFLHGLPFRLGGVSQAILNRNTIGVRFIDMSERKREQLMDLITEIREALEAAESSSD